MRISDWSSDVCSSDLARPARICPAVIIAQQSKLKVQNGYPIHHYEGLRYAKGASQGRDRRRAEGAQVSAPGIGPKYRRAVSMPPSSPEERGGSRGATPAGRRRGERRGVGYTGWWT